MNNLKESWEDLVHRIKMWLTKRHKGVCFVLAAIIALSVSWLFLTQRGYLAQRSVMKSFGQDYSGVRNVKVYSGTNMILEYSGHYSIETYEDKIVILNRDTREVVEVYGDNSVIVDSAYMEEDLED